MGVAFAPKGMDESAKMSAVLTGFGIGATLARSRNRSKVSAPGLTTTCSPVDARYLLLTEAGGYRRFAEEPPVAFTSLKKRRSLSRPPFVFLD